MTHRLLGTAAIGAAMVAIAALPPNASGWEAEITNAGLTETAALSSKLHQRLTEQFGISGGLYHRLTVPPKDAPALFEVLRRRNPTHGYVPDGRGRGLAIGWLVAGAAIADSPATFAANHFFDPRTKRGLSDETIRGMRTKLRHRLGLLSSRQDLPRSGVSALEWLVHPDNPMGYKGFETQYQKAITARTRGERDRHLAGALVAAGALVHVIEDVGSPSHSRNDLAAHLSKLGGKGEVGSRYERVAALGFGRLGIPSPTKTIERNSLAAFIHDADGNGLADITAQSWFSIGTLPRQTRFKRNASDARLASKLAKALRRPAPTVAGTLDMRAAETESGGTLRNDDGVCLANYYVAEGHLRWFISDRCALEQMRAHLPVVAAYAAGAVDFLFRGSLRLAPEGKGIAISADGADLGPGTLTVVWEDKLGVREQLARQDIGGAPRGATLLTAPAPPDEAVGVAVVFVGVDGNKEPLAAAGTAKLPLAVK